MTLRDGVIRRIPTRISTSPFITFDPARSAPFLAHASLLRRSSSPSARDANSRELPRFFAPRLRDRSSNERVRFAAIGIPRLSLHFARNGSRKCVYFHDDNAQLHKIASIVFRDALWEKRLITPLEMHSQSRNIAICTSHAFRTGSRRE